MNQPSVRKAIVIGASSGIGRELAKVLSEQGYVVGLAARRLDLLSSLQGELRGKSLVRRLDLDDTAGAMESLGGLIGEMGKVDLVVINSGIGINNPQLEWDPERAMIQVNVTGFAAMATVAMNHFIANRSGHLVGISSIAAVRARGEIPAYGASKAFDSSYLAALRNRVMRRKLPITVTDIKPGFVDTDMVRGRPVFWCASARTAAEQIYSAIQHKRKHAYVTRRWRLIAWMLRLMPDWVWARMG